MYYINPAALVFGNGKEECWIEYSSCCSGVRISKSLGKFIADNCGQAVSADQLKDVIALDKTLSEADTNILLSTVCTQTLSEPKSGYHIATQNHPFLDMSQGLSALEADARIMAAYVKEHDYPAVELSIESLKNVAIVDAINLDIDELRNSVFYQFSMILSGTFGVRLHQPAYYDGERDYHQVELLKKSIPSGGARHPTECFVEIHRSPMLETGVYYFAPTNSELQLVSRTLPTSPAAGRIATSDADWVARLVLCAAVRRSMFRYRDPRSFRALLVDVGHAEAQMSALASYCNWHYTSRFIVDFEYAKNFTDESSDDGLPAFSIGLLEGWS
ncbi:MULTISPECIES: nitroreductase family protein [Pseudomonas syringae group]|uniref:SagB/ThcOx family dehydrogenase n=1 Tax=Pseudomonas syringae TaxID=317 RepID=A0A2K4X488_PSESX|nr:MULTISPECIES: SagB/ThcOx family dehydrogenase [Pseudomonas syringae group]AVB12435.1 hypothetical protein BKM19_001375 [Pseudomonas amygdali pv. morsprunorum]KWS59937.1 hypothetical protein AL056_22305 [Pseudomonas amygdali pv. morsprunorum]KWS61281.1 hypothetical protein AL054_07320 [Pseudomonas amygdali pv. morsprunorum]PHX27748.1 hypothetical protein AO282_07095 [Pseudomonas amygdali pv. morsprunorum]POC82263.1 hypothetical protein BKM08_26675 [Pseudomonas amygdali pv. morsprunorum]